MNTTITSLLQMVAERLQATRPIVALDLETTGTNPELDHIVEITITRFNPQSQQFSGIETRVNPGMPIPAEASAVHGIADDDVRACPRFSVIASRVFELLDGADLVGYNHRRFDVRLLAVEFARYGLLNPMETARTIDVGLIFMKREPRTLEAAVRFFCGIDHADAHGTTADVVATLQVLLAQFERYPDLPRTIEALDAIGRDASFIDRDGKIAWRGGRACINFGKHAGVPLDQVETGFLAWILGRDFPDDTKEIVRAALRGELPVPPAMAEAGS